MNITHATSAGDRAALNVRLAFHVYGCVQPFVPFFLTLTRLVESVRAGEPFQKWRMPLLLTMASFFLFSFNLIAIFSAIDDPRFANPYNCNAMWRSMGVCINATYFSIFRILYERSIAVLVLVRLRSPRMARMIQQTAAVLVWSVLACTLLMGWLPPYVIPLDLNPDGSPTFPGCSGYVLYNPIITGIEAVSLPVVSGFLLSLFILPLVDHLAHAKSRGQESDTMAYENLKRVMIRNLQVSGVALGFDIASLTTAAVSMTIVSGLLENTGATIVIAALCINHAAAHLILNGSTWLPTCCLAGKVWLARLPSPATTGMKEVPLGSKDGGHGRIFGIESSHESAVERIRSNKQASTQVLTASPKPVSSDRA